MYDAWERLDQRPATEDRAMKLVIKPVLTHGIETWNVSILTPEGAVVWETSRWSETGARHAVAFWLSRYSRQLRLEAAKLPTPKGKAS